MSRDISWILVDEYLERYSGDKASDWRHNWLEFNCFSCMESETIRTIVIEIFHIKSFQTYDWIPFLKTRDFDLFSLANVSSMLLSTFSHYNGIHFFCNMYVLWSFSEPIIRMFGKEQFFGKRNPSISLISLYFQRSFSPVVWSPLG